jgi:hypothetical protein
MNERVGHTPAGRGARRRTATEQGFREAWQRLEAGTPTRPELRDHEWQLSVSAICIEAGLSRNALYDGHPDLLREIRAAIARKRQVDDQTRRTKRRNSLEAALAECRADRQRLISENAALLLRAVTAEEALARIKRGRPHAVKMTDDRPEAS